MKIILRAALCALLLFPPLLSHGLDAVYNFTDFTGTPQKIKSVSIEPISSLAIDSTNIVTGDRRIFVTDTSGSKTVSNILAGYNYRVTLTGSYTTTVFTNSFGTNVTGLVNASDYITASTNLANGLSAYSQAAADALFIAKPASPNTNDVLVYDGVRWTNGVSSGGGVDTHAGDGYQSTQIGINADAGGTNATALGGGAQADDDDGVAVGYLAWAKKPGSVSIGQGLSFGTNSIQIGHGASAIADGAIAIGGDAAAPLGSQNSIVIGNAAGSGGYSNSIAIGAGVENTTNNQVIIGTADQEVLIPGFSGGGAGDVTADGNNAFTGDNTHSGTETFSGSVTLPSESVGTNNAVQAEWNDFIDSRVDGSTESPTNFFGNPATGATTDGAQFGGLTNLTAARLGWSIKQVDSAATNHVISFTGAAVRSILATNNVQLTFTNLVVGGNVGGAIRATGGARAVSWPTNYLTLSTNGLSVAGTNWSISVPSGKVLGFAATVHFSAQSTNLVFAAQLQP